MGGLILRLRSWWDGADRNQRTVSIVGGSILAVLVVATYLFASKPRFALLAGGLSPADQGGIIQELGKMGVPYEQDQSGNISVPSDRVPELRAKLAASGHAILGESAADHDLSQLNNFMTPTVERERIKAIAEEDLAQDISYLDGIQSAKVHLALADDSPFTNDKKSASASVTVMEKPGATITQDQARGIAMMVAGAVPNLDSNNVTVLNRRGEAILDPEGDASNSSQALSTLETQRLESKRIEREIQSKLDQAFGPGSTIASVNLEINFKGEKYTETQRTPTQPISTTETSEKMPGGAGSAGPAAAGAGANTVGGATAGAGGSEQDYESKSKHSEYDPLLADERTSTGENPPGQIKSEAITVLVNDPDGKGTTTPVAAVQAFLDSYLGTHKGDPSFTAKVTATKFDTSADKEAAAAVAAAASKDRIQQILSLLPIAALIFVGLMVAKAIAKFGKVDTLVVATPDGRMVPLPSSGLSLSPGAVEATGGVLQLSEGGGSAALARPKRTAQEEEELEVDSIKRKINVPLEQIKKMSEDRPEMVAMLIKTWLMEERR